ncbi:MAG: hypothetical protein K2X87_16385 [Gemmataceae bacterium]|nr:hypothetical protein [Gemmataceae bacterium]
MATAEAPQKKPDDDPKADRPYDPSEEFPRPPDEDFWDKYSRHLEMPVSWTAAVLFHVLVGVGFLFVLPLLMGGLDRSTVPVKIMEVGGLDDEGEGSAGSGGQLEPMVGDNNPFLQKPDVPDPTDLPETKEASVEKIQDALNIQAKQNDKKAIGTKFGSGNQPGRGFDGSAGTGPGGTGNDATWKRGLGWTIRFKFEDVREYCKQLAEAQAVVFVPDGGVDAKSGTLFADLNNPKVGRPTTTSDPAFSGRLVMYEQDAKKVRLLLDYLGVGGQSRVYGVYFSREFQEEMARKELAFRKRRREDIESTTFGFVNRGGKYEVVVLDQRLKK